MSFKLPANGVCRGKEPLANGGLTACADDAGVQAAGAASGSGGNVVPAGNALASASAADALPAGVPLLFIDASAPQVQAGIWQDGRWLAHRISDAPALEEIFRSVSELVAEAGLPFAAIGGFIHNEGPGSILGIRLGAMALRIWSEGAYSALPDSAAARAPLPVWAVRSLPLVAARRALCANKKDSAAQRSVADIGVFSEFRQGLWNWFTLRAEDVFGDNIDVIETDELAQRIEALQPEGICLHLRHRKSWESPPVAVEEASADLRDCPQVLCTAGLLRRVAVAEALLTRTPEFKKTSGERHRGAAADPSSAGAASVSTSTDSSAVAARKSDTATDASAGAAKDSGTAADSQASASRGGQS